MTGAQHNGGVELEPLDSLEAAREDWQRLALLTRCPYATWEWAAKWWELEPRGRLALHACRAPGEERPWAILPLYVERERPVRVLRFLGNGVADELGPICDPSRDTAAADAMLRLLGRYGRRTVLFAERVAGDEPWQRLLDARVLMREPSPVLDTGDGSWDDWFASRSRKFRNQARKRERVLRERHGLELRLVEDGAELEAAVDTLYALHAERWEGASRAFAGRREAFHRAFARVALDCGWLRLWLAELEGAPAAASLSFRYAGVEWGYQFGRDPRWHKEEVGSALMLHTIRDAFEAGLDVYRLGRGGGEYKARVATADPGIQTLVAGATPLPSMARLGLGALRRGPAGWRRATYERYGV